MTDVFDEVGGGPTSTITYRGPKGIVKISNCKAVVTINECVVLYLEKSMVLIPWARIITIEQTISPKIKQEIVEQFKASQIKGPPKDVSVG